MRKILLAVMMIVLALGLIGGTCIPENMILRVEVDIPDVENPEPDPDPCAIVIITDWTQGQLNEGGWFPYISVYYTFENIGLETINFFRIWVTIICIDDTQIIDCSDWMDLFVPAGVTIKCKFPYAGAYNCTEVFDVELYDCEIDYPY